MPWLARSAGSGGPSATDFARKTVFPGRFRLNICAPMPTT